MFMLLSLAFVLGQGGAQAAPSEVSAFLEANYPQWSSEQRRTAEETLANALAATSRPPTAAERALILSYTTEWLSAHADPEIFTELQIDLLGERYRLAVSDYLSRPALSDRDAALVSSQIDQMRQQLDQAYAAVEANLAPEARERFRQEIAKQDEHTFRTADNPLSPAFKRPLTADELTKVLNRVSQNSGELVAELQALDPREPADEFMPDEFASYLLTPTLDPFEPPTTPELENLEAATVAEVSRVNHARSKEHWAKLEKESGERNAALLAEIQEKGKEDRAKTEEAPALAPSSPRPQKHAAKVSRSPGSVSPPKPVPDEPRRSVLRPIGWFILGAVSSSVIIFLTLRAKKRRSTSAPE